MASSYMQVAKRQGTVLVGCLPAQPHGSEGIADNGIDSPIASLNSVLQLTAENLVE